MSSSLRDFLRTAKQQLHESQKEKSPITLVMGNEKADIDTIASTLIFAYLRSSAPPQGAFSPYYIPLIQVERKSLHTVRHLTKLLPHLGLELSDLLVLDDMSLDGTQSHLSVETTRLFLINWNVLVGRQGENFSKNIAGCIDHHTDEGYVPQTTEPEPRIIGQSGSCTSLVVNAMRQPWQSIGGESESDRRSWNKHLAALGLAGVLVETKDLKHNVTREDESAYEFLEGMYGSGFDHHHFYTELIGEDTMQQQPPQYETTSAPAQATGAGIGNITQERVAESAPISGGMGSSHMTFTGNRLDPHANETVQSYHEEVLPEHVHGPTGEHLTGTTIGTDSSSYGQSGVSSGYGQSSTASATGYGAQTGSGYDTTSSTAGYGQSSSGGVTGMIGGMFNSMTGGSSTQGNTSSGMIGGSSGLTGSSEYGNTGSGLTGGSSSYDNSSSGYGNTSSGTTGGISGVVDSMTGGSSSHNTSSGLTGGSSSYDNTSTGLTGESSGYGNTSSGLTGGSHGLTGGSSSYDNSRSGLTGGSSGYGNTSSGLTDRSKYDNSASNYEDSSSNYNTTASGATGDSTHRDNSNLPGSRDANTSSGSTGYDTSSYDNSSAPTGHGNNSSSGHAGGLTGGSSTGLTGGGSNSYGDHSSGVGSSSLSEDVDYAGQRSELGNGQSQSANETSAGEAKHEGGFMETIKHAFSG